MAANGVKNKHKDFDRFQRKWKRMRDVVAGQDEIYEANYEYLPPLKDETFEEYKKRQQRTPFYNATWRTISSFVGMLFRKNAIVEVPANIEEMLKDVTLSGINFEAFAKEVVLEDLAISRIGVLVDYPKAVNLESGKPFTVAEAEKLGLRPSLSMYKAEEIINWEYGQVNNKTVLTQVRLLETKVEKISEFQSEEKKVIRVLDLFNGQYRIRLFSEDTEEQIGWDITPLMNGKPLDFIPFYPIGPDGIEHKLSEPVLIDLADLNIKHFQVSADYEHGCHMAGLPTLWIAGVGEQYDQQGNALKQEYYVGSGTAWVFPDANAKAQYAEFTGTGLGALEKNLERKENQMAALGARMLTAEKAGVEAAETLAMRHSGEHSILGSIAIAVSEGLTKALETFAKWAGYEGDIKFEITRDFMPFAISPQALTALLSAVQAGKLSHEAFFDLLKRGDLIDAETDFETEQGRIDADSENAVPAPVPLVGQKQVDNVEDEGQIEPEIKPKV